MQGAARGTGTIRVAPLTYLELVVLAMYLQQMHNYGFAHLGKHAGVLKALKNSLN